jgi:hypothetical protein
VPIDIQPYAEIGFIKYSGENLAAGIIDAGSAGSALVGLDEAIRFFNLQQSPDFASLQYDVPVQTRAGSWEAVLVAGGTVAGVFALSYVKKAGEKLAENDFKDIGLKHVFSKSMAAVQFLAKVIKHTSRSRGWQLARIEPTMGTDSVFIRNENGDDLQIPMDFYRWYQKMPPRLLVKMTSVIRKDRELSIGTFRNGLVEVVSIFANERYLFEGGDTEDNEEETLFPELVHGAYVSLEGRLIRGNEASNSVGLECMGHVLNCVPLVGSVRQYKAALFLRCRIEGRVTRHAKNRFIADRRPTVIIDKVVPLEPDTQGSLFSG